jgi:hypothetical protein
VLEASVERVRTLDDKAQRHYIRYIKPLPIFWSLARLATGDEIRRFQLEYAEQARCRRI